MILLLIKRFYLYLSMFSPSLLLHVLSEMTEPVSSSSDESQTSLTYRMFYIGQVVGREWTYLLRMNNMEFIQQPFGVKNSCS